METKQPEGSRDQKLVEALQRFETSTNVEKKYVTEVLNLNSPPVSVGQTFSMVMMILDKPSEWKDVKKYKANQLMKDVVNINLSKVHIAAKKVIKFMPKCEG